ncbi:MAG: hypothetical protein V2I33_20110, partial [Kangiellaceae bacterium]|nr:hypothetical protein [Kangiellaceae bacterium]
MTDTELVDEIPCPNCLNGSCQKTGVEIRRMPNYLILNIQRYPPGEIVENKVRFHKKLDLSAYKLNS